ncbi:phosphatidylinositol 5-phosphate 4-kinase type-2 alpha-like isoform X2 [Lineus longissimus]|uniref:phosphatidylinositol 5-phosphate 4-kinase type-2 alpha-like isoform X2 n=1 Tax=Lineus longissimus TaxID=88925 RepID=UPI00315C52C1
MATDSKKKKFKAVPQKVKLFRPNDHMSVGISVFMWGVNHSIQELSHVNLPVMLMPDDFKAYSKTRVDNHLFNKENMPSHFKVKEYCPVVFRNLRERFGIDDIDYSNSLTKKPPQPLDSPGRSGSKFFLSYDKQYLIKTLVSEEVEQMHHILKEYHCYVVERHAVTLLPHYLGMYRYTVNDQEHYMLVMRNVFSPRLMIHKKYDLKGSVTRNPVNHSGSTVDRQASDKEKAKELPTFKDNDFVKDGETIHIGDQAKEALIETLSADVEFLSKHNLMDYSLLIGIHDCEQGEEGEEEDIDDPEDENGVVEDESDSVGSAGGIPTPPDSPTASNPPPFTGEIDPKIEIFGIPSNEGAPRKVVYFMALIDILTHYGVKKRTAQAAKTVKHGAGAEISTVKPEQYMRRFLEFVTKNIQ